MHQQTILVEILNIVFFWMYKQDGSSYLTTQFSNGQMILR